MRIKNALISVYHKEGLGPIVDSLSANNTTIYSTGGTQAFIEERGIKVERVEDLTSYPSILGGRVKTLHPKVFGGILARRDNEGDQSQMKDFEIPYFDLVIVDLYPFEETVASGAVEQEIIDKIIARDSKKSDEIEKNIEVEHHYIDFSVMQICEKLRH